MNQIPSKKLLWILWGSGAVLLLAGGVVFAGWSHFQKQERGAKVSEDHVIAFMQRYEPIREENYQSMVRRGVLEEFEQQLKRTQAALTMVFDAGKTDGMFRTLSAGLLALGILFLAAGIGVAARFPWGRPLAFWSVATFGAGYIVYALYRIYDGYRSVKISLEHHYSVVTIANPASSAGNASAEALWAVILNFFSSPSVILHLLTVAAVIVLLRILR